MLSCELHCSFRAARQVRLSLLQQNSYNPFFSPGALSQGVRALFMSISCTAAFLFSPGLSCLARREPSHCLPAEAFLSCSGVPPASVGSALLPCVFPCSPVYMGVVRTAVAMADSLCYDRLRRQWQSTSVGVECLVNGGCPSPTELHCPGFSCACRETLNPERFQLLGFLLLLLLLWG